MIFRGSTTTDSYNIDNPHVVVKSTCRRPNKTQFADSFRLFVYLHPLQIDRIHNGSLEEFHGREMALKEPFQLQIGRFPIHSISRCAQFRGHGNLFVVVGWLVDWLGVDSGGAIVCLQSCRFGGGGG